MAWKVLVMKIHASWWFLVSYQCHLWRWLFPPWVTSVKDISYAWHFLVSHINHTIDYDAILCNYAPLSSCKIRTFYGYQQYTCSFRKYYWIMTSGHLNADISRTKNFTLPVFWYVVAKTLSFHSVQRSHQLLVKVKIQVKRSSTPNLLEARK